MFLALVALLAGTAHADGADDYYSTAESIVVVTATSAGRGALTASEDGTYLHSASYTGLTMSTTTEASYLVFYPAGDDYYYIYSVDAGKLLNSTAGALTDGDGDTTDPLLFTIGDLTGGYGYTGYAILESSGLRYNIGGSYQTTIDSWGTSSGWSDEDDAGNSFTFSIIEDVETSDIPSTIETILANIEEAKENYEEVTYYSTEDDIVVVTATSAGRGSITATADGSYLQSSSYSGATMSSEDDASYIVLYPTGNYATYSGSSNTASITTDSATYYIYSVAAGKLLNSTAGALTDGDGDTTDPLEFVVSGLVYWTEGSPDTDTYCFGIYEADNSYRYNFGGSSSTEIAEWGSISWGWYNDVGNCFKFEVVSDVDTDGIADNIATILENIEAAQEAASSYEDVTSLDQLGSSVTVIMQSARGVVASELGSTFLTSESSIDTSDETQKFVFYTTDDIDGYYLYSVNNAAFVTVYSDDDGSLSLDPTTFSILSSADNADESCEADTDTYPWIVKTTVGETAYLMNSNNAGDVVVDDWDDVDEGNAHRFVIVDEETDYADEIEALLTETKKGAQVRVEDFLSNSMVIKMRADRDYGGYPTYDSSSTYGLTAVEDEADDESQSFVLYTTDAINGYYLYSVGAEQFVVANSSYYAELSDTPEIWTLSQDGYSEPTQSWRLYNSSSYYITAYGWTGYPLQATWWYADAGNSFRFIIENAADADVEDEIEALLASGDEWLQAHPAILTLDELDDSIAEGYTFYIKGALPGFVYAGESGLNASLSTASPSAEFDTSYEFGLIKHDEGEYFIYSVGQKAMLESDLVPNNRCVGLFMVGSPSSFTSLYWGDNGADTGSYPFWICDSVGANNINYNSDQGVVMTSWSYSDTGNCYVFHVGNATEELPEVYDVKISGLGWRTLALPVATVIQSAVTAYSATSVSTTSVRFDEITDDVLGAEEGVVLYAKGGGTFYFPESSETGSTSSVMTGVVDEGGYTFTTAGEAYVLRASGADDDDNDLGIVFSLVEANETIDQYKAYVTAPADGSSISFSFGGTLVEGIGSVETAVEATGIYYDLQGRRVKNPQKGGIYIVDGKKVII